MKRVWMSAMIALLVMMVAGCNEDEPKPKPEPEPKPEQPEEPSKPDEPEVNLYPELPGAATEVPRGFFTLRYAPQPLPSTLRVIREKGFYACLNKVLVIPEGVEKIEQNGLAKGSSIWGNRYDGNVEWIYIPRSVKKLMSQCLKGVWTQDLFHYYVSNPSVVMASETPPDGFMDAIHYSSDELLESQIIYVPESGLNNYVALMEKFFSEKGSLDIAQLYYHVYSYCPVSVEITGGGKESDYQYGYEPKAENQGEIKSVRWAVSDESIVSIWSNGAIYPRKTGRTYIQCIVSTPASDGTDIEFYFFKPIEVTTEMLESR